MIERTPPTFMTGMQEPNTGSAAGCALAAMGHAAAAQPD
jgi:hypothetical protein